MLEMIGVDYAYPGSIAALSGVSLSLSPGERVAILGANGAGKSTLLSILNGTMRPARGVLRLNGGDVRYDRNGLRELRSQVGMVLQDPDDQLFAASVFEDVSFGPANMGLAEAEIMERVDAALHAVEIADLRERPTHMLSFGQRKRVAIAGIVAMRPRYLLLDEPSAGLDPIGVTQLMATLARISATDTAIMLATHDVDSAYAWADRIVIFGAGRIARSGAPDTVFADGEVLRELRMRPPLIWELARILRANGALDASLPLPRDRDGIIRQIEAGARTAQWDPPQPQKMTVAAPSETSGR
jgi:cobalt/nickel transport system ATP-binding protein